MKRVRTTAPKTVVRRFLCSTVSSRNDFQLTRKVNSTRCLRARNFMLVELIYLCVRFFVMDKSTIRN